MDEILYNSLYNYFHALQLKGYMPYKAMVKLLVLGFYRDFVFSDYRGIITRDDYLLIERALDCLYGTTCLIPYPDYLKMGKLHLGEITELSHRLQALEDEEVLKAFPSDGSAESDIIIISDEDN